MKNVMAIASVGGHWVQLLRLIPAFSGANCYFVSTRKEFSVMVEGYKYYSVPDANRSSPLSIFRCLFAVAKVVLNTRPDIVITTGAAPGLLAIIIAKLIGARTIWVDSIANIERISLSGRIARIFADRVYTQWPHLAKNGIVYSGNVLS